MEENIDLDNDTICGICYAEFLDLDDLELHITQYHLNETNKHRFCKFCSKIFCDIDAFALHIRNFHLSTLKTCKHCTRVYNDAGSLSIHEKKHKSAFYYPKIACSHCIKVFKNKKELENHEYDKHRDSEDGVMLQHCFPELSSLININVRKFFKGLHEDYLYRCIVCEISTPDVTVYINHLLTKNCQSFACNLCCNVFSWKSKLRHHCKAHIQAQNALDNGNKQCQKCNKYFHFTKLKSHLKECTSMKCIPCDVSFDSVDKFAFHVTTHSHRTPVQIQNCKYCRRPFIGLNALQKHVERSHKHNLHLYKYHCKDCDIIFKHPKLLFGHFFTKHKDVNPYTCKICNQSFRIRKNFTLHIKLDHKSVGFVEFDSNFHVFFTDKKSDKPFQPKNPDIADSTEKNTDQDILTDFEDDNKITEDKDTEINNSKTDNNVKSDQISNKATDSMETSININTSEDLEKTEDLQEETISEIHDSIEEINTNTLSEEKSSSEIQCNESEVDKPNADKIERKIKQKRSVGRKIIAKNKTGIKFVNVNSDFMTVTETETEADKVVKRKTRTQKRRLKIQTNQPRKRRRTKNIDIESISSDDSNVPLSRIMNKKTKLTRNRRIKRKILGAPNEMVNRKKMKFICFKCDRNCYTFQNYHRHMSMHLKTGQKFCVKCYGEFKTKDELNNHMKTEHSSSKLTETLKKLLEQRKSNTNTNTNDEPVAESTFTKTIQKVPTEKSDAKVTIKEVENDKLSVKKFIENFKPDTNDTATKKISISNSLSIRPVNTIWTEPLIKMKKFNPEPTIPDRPQLRMPVKFRDEPSQEHRVSIKLVHCEYATPNLNFDHEVIITDLGNCNNETCFEGSYDDGQKTDNIPDVGHEVMLEDTDLNSANIVKKTIVLKDLLCYNNVRIGHLAPKAPFYKIVKIDEVLQEKPPKVEPPKPINITLPNGTKLVSVNPLAHLLGNKSIADIPNVNPYKNKTYSKPKTLDFTEAIVKAMKALDKTPVRKKHKKKIENVE